MPLWIDPRATPKSCNCLWLEEATTVYEETIKIAIDIMRARYETKSNLHVEVK